MGGFDFGWNKNVADNDTTDSFDLNKYFSEVHSTIYTVASIQFDKNQLKLSHEAFQRLTTIQKESHKCNPRRDLYDLCKTFFDDFGSHIYCGQIDLGGVLTKTSTFHGETNSSTDEIHRAVSSALKAHTGFGYGEVNFGMSAIKMKTEGEMTKAFNEDLLDNTHVVCRQYGGPPISKNFTEDDWKESLSTSRSNWVVIDKKEFKESDYLAVWEMLPEDVFNASFCDMLYRFYVTFFYRQEIYRITQAVCNREKPLKLELLKDAICDIYKKTNYINTIGIKGEWLFFVTGEKYITDFLLTPRSYYTKLQTGDLETIEKTVGQLMGFFDGTLFSWRNDIGNMLREIQKRIGQRNVVLKLVTEKTGTHYKLISLSSYVATLMPGEWVKILREFQTVPQFLLDCLSKTSLKSVSNGDAEEMIGMVDKLVARAGGEDFFNRTEIEGQLDRLKGKSKPKSFLSVLKKNLL